ncbi:nitrate- and nitrite sensing domain-containing protein [Actinomadura sp. DC4]|uniref:sensor histidine kinase n=1 Tax=Actinomadura sp. DC4 TaxID=3055069 RepID=UPI0025AFB58C|nr:nitrate- and nitrite sensing domain-containing protein [Actinomadura sp. DC4]MDN3351103.1 nitrate- and nitrite sensing domain-containing protein [Actinomadura sp. DC4]
MLLLVPLLSLAAVWAFAAYLASRDALSKYEASTTYDRVGLPGTALIAALEQERSAAAVSVATVGQNHGEVAAARTTTDAAQAAFRRSALSDSARRTMSGTTKQRLDELLRKLDGLTDVRSRIDGGAVDTLGAVNEYNAVADALLRLFGSVVLINDPLIYQQGTAIVDVSTAYEFMLRDNALVTAALAGRVHRLSNPEFIQFRQNADNGRLLFDTGLAVMKPSLRGALDELAASTEFRDFRTLEETIAEGGARASLAPRAERWRSSVTPLATTWSQATNQAGAVLTAEAKPIGDRIMYTLYAAAGFGLLAVALSIAVSILFGRTLARELIGLQRAALVVAGERLPNVIRRLRAGEKVNVDAEVPPVTAGKSSEVTRVAEALTTLQRTAIESAVGEAKLRQGINQVFLNLAWRSQSLLHRQLSMLDTMEKEASDPDALEDLFALDHLTTRMRRHAEGLVILSGAAPARGWHNPVAVRDILRGAIAEVEEYTRVIVDSAAPAALDGSVVADITHLVAELIENATTFSPPPTHVHVRGELAANGYGIEIEDRGIGMNDEELADANRRLEHPPEFDSADGDRLGLFIVGRLAERHGIDVHILTSPYGGVRATILIPLDYIAKDDGAEYEQTWVDEPGPPPWQAWESNPVRPGSIPGPVEPGPAYITGPTRMPGPELEPVSESEDYPDDASAPELPQRIRQASLAPQLRAATPARTPSGTSPATTRPPEETRSLMSSLQQGWQRGREEEDPDE